MKNFISIGLIAARELVHEKAVYVLLSFAVLSVGFSFALGQLTYTDRFKLTLDFMIGTSHITLVLFSIFVGITLFQRENALGSIHMTLAKPMSRATFLLGKFLGQVFIQTLIAIGLTFIILAVTSPFGTVNIKSLIQCMFLIWSEALILSAVAYFFSVNSGAMTSAVASLCILAFGHARTVISKTIEQSSSGKIWDALSALLPNLEILNMKHLLSYGIALPQTSFLWASTYALVCASLYLILACLCFERKDIA